MSELEWVSLACNQDGHNAIKAAIQDFEQLGYLVQRIGYKGGLLEVVCAAPKKGGEGSGTFGGVSI